MLVAFELIVVADFRHTQAAIDNGRRWSSSIEFVVLRSMIVLPININQLFHELLLVRQFVIHKWFLEVDTTVTDDNFSSSNSIFLRFFTEGSVGSRAEMSNIIIIKGVECILAGGVDYAEVASTD